MSGSIPASSPADGKRSVPRCAKHVFWGALAGLALGWLAVFAISLFHGNALGLSGGECLALGCTLTLFLSQPAGLGGMVVGALAGATVCGVSHHARKAGRPASPGRGSSS